MPKRIPESGLHVDPPEGYFRLDESPYFIDHFKRRGLCEMDFGWWDPTANVVHLLELKDYSIKTLPPDLAGDLAQKATDCLLLLASIYYEMPHATGIKGMLPEGAHSKPTPPAGIQLTFVIRMARPDQAHELQSMSDRLKNLLGGRLELLDLRHCTKVLLLDQWTARDFHIPIVLDDEPAGSKNPMPVGRGTRPDKARGHR